MDGGEAFVESSGPHGQSDSSSMHQEDGRNEITIHVQGDFALAEHCIANNIMLKAIHIAGKLNVLADQLSHPNQVIQTKWTQPGSVQCHVQPNRQAEH